MKEHFFHEASYFHYTKEYKEMKFDEPVKLEFLWEMGVVSSQASGKKNFNFPFKSILCLRPFFSHFDRKKIWVKISIFRASCF